LEIDIMRLYCAILRTVTISALVCGPLLAYAQAPTAATPSTSLPGKASVKVDMVPSLFVLNAHGATLQGQTLRLAGVSPTSIVFADRPVRAAGHVPTETLLAEWTTGDFAKDAPNATVSVLSKDGLSAHDVVVELRSPHLEGDRLTFDVRVLEGDLAAADGPAAVFVDIIGMPLTPMSFAGVARRTARRAYWYGAATAPYYRPYGYPGYYPPPYAPYPYPY
jgi:hypothetical protein